MGIDTMMKAMIAEAVQPLNLEIQQLKEQLSELKKSRESDLAGLIEVKGFKAAMESLNIGDHHVIAQLIRTGVLGSALWKTPTEKQRGRIYCTPAIARRRYHKYLMMPANVKEAWEQLGADLCEKQWKEMGI